MSVVVVGANHRTAPLALLERMAVSGDRLPKLLSGLAQSEHTSEVVILSTCNRTEVYVIAERFHGAYQEVRDFFADLTFLPPEDFADSLYVHHDDDAVRHLFEVVAGIDSAVPGEHEILGQVRDAWDVARTEGTSRRSLNLLFRHALEVGKRARTETRIAQHVTSVSHAAVIMAGERLGGFAGRKVVLVGAGTIGRGMASFLAQAGVAEIVVANRTIANAVEVVTAAHAESPGLAARAIGLGDLADHVAASDVLFTATATEDPVIGVDLIRAAVAERDEPMLIVDVAVPRDVDPAVADLDGVALLDMATIAEFTGAGIASRRREIAAVQVIVDEELDRFVAGSNAREVSPVITAMRQRAEDVRLAELDRFGARLGELPPEQREVVEALTRGIVAKLMHDPTVRLKDAAGSSRGERLADSLRELFDLS
ncbi:MAG: glutamyl-tRNA reductase [Acidimicrobiales bacterium]